MPSLANNPPTFVGRDTDTLEVAENTAARYNVGDPITATDEDDDSDTLTYTLSGTHAAAFDIDRSIRPVADQGRLGL